MTQGARPRSGITSRPPDRRVTILIAATLAVFAALGLGRMGYAPVLPAMQAGLGLSNTEAGALASWNLGAYVIVAVAAGLLAGRVGTRLMISAGLVVAGLSMLATGMADGIVSASVARAATGIGGGMTNVPAVALAASWFGTRRRGLATGVVVSGSSVALVLLGPSVPRVVAAFDEGWRVCWYGFGAVTLVIAVLCALLLRDPPRAPARDTDAPGRADAGISHVLRSGFVWRISLVYFAFGFSYVIYMTFFVKRLTDGLGMSPGTAGTLFMIVGWASLFCGVIWGHVSDIIGRRHTLAIVFVLHAVSFAAFALWTSMPGLLLSAVLFGLSAWSVPGIVGAACGDTFRPGLVAGALGVVTLSLGIGQALGPLVGGMLADSYGSFVPSYLVAAAVALAGALAALLLPRRNVRPHAPLPVRLNQRGDG